MEIHIELEKKTMHAVTRIRTWVASATTKSTNHYTITAIVHIFYLPNISSVLKTNT